jgi:hypothetical protein
MNATPSQMLSPPPGSGTRFRNTVIGAFFALLSLVPKVLHLRRNERSWTLFRLLLGLSGASLVILPIGLGNSYFLSLVGLAMFIAAILLPPANPDTSANRKARELGALAVVNGGRYQRGSAAAATVRLFVGPERIWVLDARFESLLVVPVSEITSARAERSQGSWLLRVVWADRCAQFSYRGIFAEHLARLAESSVHTVMRPSLPAIPQARAANA